jgi:tetratricopeptide (TPR) repeat protein
MELLKEGRIEEAIATCNTGLEVSPTDEILWQIKGVCLAKQGEYGEGLNCIDRALQSNAGNPHCWVLKCSLLRSLNRTEERLECWRRVIKIAPDFESAWKEIGNCLFGLGRFQDAAQAYDSQLKLNPLDAECVQKRDIALITEEMDIDWTHPTLLLDIGSWWREPISSWWRENNYPELPGMRCFNFVCELKYLPDSPQHAKRFYELRWQSDNPRNAARDIVLYLRSRSTGELWELGKALLLVDQKGGPLILELLRAFPEDRSDEECTKEMADAAYQTLAYDWGYGNVILFSWR